MSICTATRGAYQGAVRASHGDTGSMVLLGSGPAIDHFISEVLITFHSQFFTDPTACADEIAAVIAKYRRADKPAEAV